MILTVKRDLRDEESNSIFGTLSIDHKYECETLENLALAIPAGIYPIEFYTSPSFNLLLPLLEVPGRKWIEIHPANWSTELRGCLAVGKDRNPESLSYSRLAFTKLMSKIQDQKKLDLEIY